MTQPTDEAAPASEPLTGEAPLWEPAVPESADEAAPTPTSGAATDADLLPANASRPKAIIAPRRANSVTALLAISTAIAVGGLGFAAGRFTTSAQTSSANGNGGANGGAPLGPNASGAPGDGWGFGGSATVSGTVVSVGTDSFTVKLASGETVTVATGSSTTYHAQTSGSSSDLAAGQAVTVQTSGGNVAPGASAGPGTQTTRTATDVTITSE